MESLIRLGFDVFVHWQARCVFHNKINTICTFDYFIQFDNIFVVEIRKNLHFPFNVLLFLGILQFHLIITLHGYLKPCLLMNCRMHYSIRSISFLFCFVELRRNNVNLDFQIMISKIDLHIV